MRFFYARSVAALLGLACLASGGRAQDVGLPSLLPIPPAANYSVAQAAATGTSWYDESPASPSDKMPLQAPQQAPGKSVPYQAPYQSPQQIDSCTSTVGGSCGCNCRYIYANGLYMTRSLCDVPTSVDTDPVTVLSTGDVQGGWSGGFEIGVGTCLNGGNLAAEVVYWGLFPGTQYADFYGADATGALNPHPGINFSTLDYSDGFNTGTAFEWYEDAELHHLQSTYSVNSVELNLLGNCCGCGGPFGCAAACGGSGNCGGSPWGFGWIAGLRYFNFDERLLFCTDDVDTVIDGSDGELHYDVETTNDLFGFQLGGGINRCIGCKWSLYGLGKVGVYANDSSMRQSVYGPNGLATVNTGVYDGEEFDVRSSETKLAMLGQVDLGARYQINCRWSAQFGYRVVAASGVALTSDNIARDFADLEAVEDYNRCGTLLLHGGYAGLTFCW
jgi:hypothetical protein